MRTPVRHLTLVLLGFVLAIISVLATGPGTALPPSTGWFAKPQLAQREGRLATPDPGPLCSRLPARHHGNESNAATPPSALNVPILAYHYVRTTWTPGDELGRRLSVTPAEFAAQMKALAQAGVHTVSLADVLAALQGQVELPSHAVVLTFDDGHGDFLLNALPVLREHHFCATAFIVPDFLGRPAYLTAPQVQQVAAAGIVIGAHTMDHLDLTKQPPPLVADQVARSRDLLHALTGQPVDDFAYPYGLFDATAIAAAQSAGFADAVGLAATLPETAAARFSLPRHEIIGGESLARFAADAGIGGIQPARLESTPWPSQPSQPAASGASRSSSATSPE